jgi:Baseplate J-like protein
MELPEIQLDPRNEWELFEQAQNHVFNVSGGRLGSRNPADPLSFLLEGQVYAGAELLWYINQLPDKLLARWLGYWGLELSEGTKATGSATFQLVQVNTAIVIPAGTLVSAGDVIFQTTNPVTTLPNSTSIESGIEALEVGRSGNVPGYGIQQIVTPLPYVRSVSNPQPTVGGRDAVAADDAIRQFLANPRDSILMSEQDYVRASYDFLGGSGWMVRVIPNTDPTTSLPIPGTIAVLVSNSNYTSLPSGILDGLSKHLKDRSVLTISPYVIEMGRYDVSIRINAIYSGQDDPQLVADNIVAGIYSHLADQAGERIGDRDMVLISDDAGCQLITASFNNAPQIASPSLRQILYPKYIEVRLAVEKDYKTDVNDIRQLFGSPSTYSLFVYGEGEGDALV